MSQSRDPSSLEQQAYIPDHRLELVRSPKWIRVLFDGEFIVDSRQVLILRESGHTPVYYFPESDVRMDLLHPSEYTTTCPYKGRASYWNISTSNRTTENIAWSYRQPLERSPDLSAHIAFDWGKIDAMFEEDERIHVHPRDPYTRIDALRSSRHVRVVMGGVTIAESTRPTLLFETGLPTRFYLPVTDVRKDLLVDSDTLTRCPYKGEARYYSVRIGEDLLKDLIWYYPYPTMEAAAIRGQLCFYQEKIDEFYIDGELQASPDSPWSP